MTNEIASLPASSKTPTIDGGEFCSDIGAQICKDYYIVQK